jgi:hypothetical protein
MSVTYPLCKGYIFYSPFVELPLHVHLPTELLRDQLPKPVRCVSSLLRALTFFFRQTTGGTHLQHDMQPVLYLPANVAVFLLPLLFL